MAKGIFAKAAQAATAIRRDLGGEFAYALDDIRHKVVEQGFFGQAATPEAADFYRWLGNGPAQGTGKDAADAGRDPMGRTAGAEAKADHEPVELEPTAPMEGTPGNAEERKSTAFAYARHQQAGPRGVMEMDDAHSFEWREFENWLDGQGDGWGRDDDGCATPNSEIAAETEARSSAADRAAELDMHEPEY